MDGFISLGPSDLTSAAGVAKLNNMLQALFQNSPGDGVSISDFTGYGSPEGVLAAGIGATYRRIDGGVGTSYYVKSTGTGNTGWVAMTSSPVLPLSVANGGTGGDFSATAQGSVPFFSGTGVLSALGAGTSGFFLQTQGTSANPVWAAVPSQYFSLVSTTVLSTVSSTGSIAISKGHIYFVKFNFINFSGTSTIRLNFNGDTGGNYSFINILNTTSAASTNNAVATTSIVIGTTVASAATKGIQGSFFIEQLSGSQVYRIWGECIHDGTSLLTMSTFSGTWADSADVSGFSLATASPTMSGSVSVWALTTV